MTRSNRILNRVVLALVGLGLLGLALGLASTGAAADGALEPGIPRVDLDRTAAALRDPAALVALALGAAAVAVAALAWMLTRGRGRTTTLAAEPGLQLDADVLGDLLRAELAGNRAIAGVRLSVSRLRRRRVALVRLGVRPGADLVELRADLESAVARSTDRLGLTVPLAVVLDPARSRGMTGAPLR